MSDSIELPDPAATFASALSIWEACTRAADRDPALNLSEAYQGMDNLMRVAMSIGTRFEDWACENIAFEALVDVWPYLLEDRFGDACLQSLDAASLERFGDNDCLRVALLLKLPVRAREGSRAPVDVAASDPVPERPLDR